MKIRPLGLLLPAVLAGCVSQSANHDRPAYVYVDGLIADNVQTISHAQAGLNQAGPNSIRPVSPANNIKPALSIPSTSQSQTHLSHVTNIGHPGPLLFPQPAGYTRGLTVAQTMKRIIPTGWAVNWAPGTEPAQHRRVNLSLNDQWPRVLNNLMSSRSLYATVEWGNSRVTITPQDPRSPVLTTK
ncbi:hypothetical protein [Serratia ficaria]|uniref:hypothetical protein n=1 Tax=Serratia ficaria TaxID=61651 RepID=UPI000B29B359|nr:hypothetical protein [Serratia ficaria]